ncbi:hypothetical protein ACFVU2_19290 [Leifsonia sp. NPDC058194]|uniref:hypothetical protein n=1 Tax=Leifsonia sp. NPDC058194 TaxID=3346374 RepID=UPI0036DEC343
MLSTIYPRVPLKEMDGAMLAYELSREIDRVVADPMDRDMITSAAMLATHLHRHQTRRVRHGLPRTPYIEHPLRNALRLIRWGVTGASPVRIAQALLHDVVEDRAVEIVEVYLHENRRKHVEVTDPRSVHFAALDWLGESYGHRLSLAVDLVSNRPGDTRDDYQYHVERLAQLVLDGDGHPALDALLVKASDLVDNAGSLRHQLAAGDDPIAIERLAKKYHPVLRPVIGALRAVVDTEFGIENAIEALEKVERSLEDILSGANL